MTLSIAQRDAEKEKYQRWFYLHERDLLECARRYPDWRVKANELGFSDEKIDAVWPHADEGRKIKYMESPFYKEMNRRQTE